MTTSLPRVLEDVTVLDLTTALAGPFATLLLAGLGARVIKIENPGAGDTCRENAPYLGREGASLVRRFDDDISISALNRLRGKQGITLNLKHPEAQGIFADLAKKSDMLVENFSRGTLDRLGAGYDAVHSLNPALVYCSITGFGTRGAASGTGKAMDTIIQALSGVMFTSGNATDGPVRLGVPFADLTAPLFGIVGALAALHQSRKTGEGQHVDISMLGALTSLVAAEPFDIMERLGVPQRTGPRMTRLSPFGIYPTRDGHVAICAPMEGFARAVFQAIGRPELANDPNFNTRDARVKNVKQMDAIIESYTTTLSTAEAFAQLEYAGVPCAEVRDPSAAIRDPQVLAREETIALEHPRYGATEEVYGMGFPIRFSGAVSGCELPPPELGEHNDAVYSELLGYSKDRLAELRMNGVI